MKPAKPMKTMAPKIAKNVAALKAANKPVSNPDAKIPRCPNCGTLLTNMK